MTIAEGAQRRQTHGVGDTRQTPRYQMGSQPRGWVWSLFRALVLTTDAASHGLGDDADVCPGLVGLLVEGDAAVDDVVLEIGRVPLDARHHEE